MIILIIDQKSFEGRGGPEKYGQDENLSILHIDIEIVLDV